MSLAISEYIHTARRVSAPPDRILVTLGLQQSVDLVTRTLEEPGDKVCIEDPGYIGLKGVFTASGDVLSTAAVDKNGPIVREASVTGDGTRLAIVTPIHQFSTGTILSF